MSPKIKNIIELHCYKQVADVFAIYQSESYHPPGFGWDKFPEMIAIQCRDTLFHSMEYTTNHVAEYEDMAFKLATTIATRLVEMSGMEFVS
jgi:hypothetical protein